MKSDVPIKIAEGVELVSKSAGVATVKVNDFAGKNALSWDRFVRLKATAEALLASGAKTVLDAGGYDGALGLFLRPEHAVDLIDEATTGGTVLDILVPDCSYDAVVAVDVLEHIKPQDRYKALRELARIAKRHVILNYPCRDSKDAQELVYILTNNSLIHEHVKWELPDSTWVLSELQKHGFTGTLKAHTSVAIWLGQYITLSHLPVQAKDLNCHLIQHYADEPCSRALYHLVVCERTS